MEVILDCEGGFSMITRILISRRRQQRKSYEVGFETEEVAICQGIQVALRSWKWYKNGFSPKSPQEPNC
jgi:hypothetical protein